MKKIINYIGVLALTASTSLTSYGKAVNESTAKAIGSNFLISTYPDGAVKSTADLTTSYVASTQTDAGVITDYYVFNVIGSNGFVMVSADDNIQPILAYSSESSFNINTMSPSAKNWVDGYKNDITTAILNKVPAQAGTNDKWNELSQAVTRRDAEARKTTSSFPSSSFWLLGTMVWNQSVPTGSYNADCPGGSVTGCVATAMAQVMKFWNWPTVGSGSHTYTQNPNPAGYPAQTADFGNTAYGWSLMSNIASNSSVALLMYHCGVSLDMNYSPTESGTYVIELESPYKTNCAEYALKTFFHYKRSTLRGIPRFGESGAWPNDPTVTAMTDPAWIAMLKTELDAGRPVIYSGNSTTAGGHCWVADGYDASSKMHFNFGWDGQSDGYYTVNSINPASLGIGGGGGNFNDDQCAVIGILPDSFATLTGPIQMNSRLDIPSPASSPVNYSPSFTCTAKIINSGTASFSGDFCAQIYDTLFNLVDTVQIITGQTIAAGASTGLLTFTPTKTLYSMIPAPYNVRIMYRAAGTTKWTPVANNGAFYNENLIQVGNMGFGDMELAAPINLTSTSGTINIKRKSTLTFTTKIQNQTGGNFNGNVQAVLTNVVTGTAYPVQLQTTSLFYSATDPYTFTSTSTITAPTGIYALSVQHEATGAISYTVTGSDFYENPILVNVVGATGVTTPSAIADKISVYPNPANNVINIAVDGVNIDQVRITDIQGRQVQQIVPGANQSIITLPVSSYASGIYFVNLYSGEEVVTKKIVIAK